MSFKEINISVQRCKAPFETPYIVRIYIYKNECLYVPYAFLYHSSDCDETSVSCCAHAREGLLITFLLLSIKTFTKSAKFHEIFNELLGMSALHLMYDVRDCLARGRSYHDHLPQQRSPPS
jgi:hypothetical protein